MKPARTASPDGLSPDTLQVLLCDLQPEIVARSRTQPPDAIASAAEVLCRAAALHDLPITMSVVPEDEKPGRLIDALRPFADRATVIERATATPFNHPPSMEALAAHGRTGLVLAGCMTEVVVLHTAIRAIAAGYDVYVPVDACGGMSARTEDACFAQLAAWGAIRTSVVSVATAIGPDFTTPKGRALFGIVQTLRLA